MQWLTCTSCDPRTQAEGLLWSNYFQKNSFAYLKGYIFHFNTPQVNLISSWALNWPLALEFEHYWETGARIVRGNKFGVYSWPFSQDGN